MRVRLVKRINSSLLDDIIAYDKYDDIVIEDGVKDNKPIKKGFEFLNHDKNQYSKSCPLTVLLSNVTVGVSTIFFRVKRAHNKLDSH